MAESLQPAAERAQPSIVVRVWRELHRASVGWALALAVAVALALNPIFVVPLPVLLGRTLFVALMLVLVFHGVGLLRQTLLPRWLAQTVAVALTAPVATAIVYLVATSGDVQSFIGNPYRVSGFLWIAGCALGVGLLVALGALVRERDALARSQALQFEIERGRLERQALDARLAVLTAQIEPHFLFNTLANVQALVDSGSPRAAPVLKSLIAYLRAAMPRLQEGGLSVLRDELDLVRAYLDLMQLRMPDRLQVVIDVDADLLGCRFPPMLLLTLAENAVRHGIDPSEQGGRIEVGGRIDAATRRVRLWVADTGLGLRSEPATGTGLTNARERLRGVFGADAQLTLGPGQPRGTRAELSFTIPPP
ncbi:MAG TPA: histidine kinase [Burkholderiaceae bacterium]|nr:histidine kinase [Burkholderiaceae bacterium]